jgi:acetyl esterase
VSVLFADSERETWLRQQPPFSEPDLAVWRTTGAERAAHRPRDVEMHQVVDFLAAGVLVRLYIPFGEPGSLLVYLHGGGWTIGSPDSHDTLCRVLADGAGGRVLSVGYRLAPEYPWPASVEAAVAVLRWVATSPER